MKSFVKYFVIFLIIVFTALISYFLVVIRDNKGYSPSQPEMFDKQIDYDTDKKDSKPLYDIWTSTDYIAPKDLIKGGQATLDKFRKDLHKIGGYEVFTNGIIITINSDKCESFTSTLMLIKQLRHVRCHLPIHVFLNNFYLNFDQEEEMKKCGVLCTNLITLLNFRFKNKFNVKVLSMYFSVFDNVLYLDSNVNVLKSPESLFHTENYLKHSALFWSNHWHLNVNAPCYYQYPNENVVSHQKFHQDSSIMMININRYWKQVWYVSRILENKLSNLFPSPFNDGDNNLYTTTWEATSQSYEMIKSRPSVVGNINDDKKKQFTGFATLQYSVDGSEIFLIQHSKKWHEREDFKLVWKHQKRFTDPVKGYVDDSTYNMSGKGVESVEVPRKSPIRKIEKFTLDELKQLRECEWYIKQFLNRD